MDKKMEKNQGELKLHFEDHAFNKDMKKHDDTTYESLVKQIEVEYQLSWIHQYEKLQTNLSRLKLYNNQRKSQDTIGDPLLFTIFQTVFAALYDDQLSVNFMGREEGDDETGENLTSLALYDYDLMGKDIVDHDWIWDTLFFSRGLLKLWEFDRSDRFMCPIPEVIDPMSWLRDPRASSVNGDIRGRGGMRFGGREIYIPRSAITSKAGYVDYENLKLDGEIKSIVQKAKEARDDAQGLDGLNNRSEDELGDNAMVQGLEWFTNWKGKRVMVELANGRKKVIKYTEVGNNFPIIDRPLYPTAHDWNGTSLPDIVEDKQRHRSVVLNLLVQGMKADLYPMYLYDEKRIKNKGDLMNFKFNKFVGIQGEGDIRGAVEPMNKSQPRMDIANFVLDTLDSSAQRASATPDIQQGQVSNQKRTLGELNLVASRVDTRYSLTAKVFGWSERAFWNQWYGLYKEHFKSGIDEKVIRIVGSFGAKWRPLTKENLIADKDPDVVIDSKQVSEAKNVRERMLFGSFANTALADPDSNKRYILRHLAKLNNLSKDEIQRVFPPVVDELIAEDENDKLSQNVLMPVSPKDNHMIHLDVHGKAAETPAKKAHIDGHRAMMAVKKDQPELFTDPATGQPTDQQNQPIPQANGAVKPANPLNVTPSSVASPQAGAALGSV